MELGSEYNLDLSCLTVKDNNIFRYLSNYRNRCFFDSGRSALKHVSRCISCEEKILLPEFICESVTNCFDRNQIDFYKLNGDLSINIESLESLINEQTRVIYITHYFGALLPENQLKEIDRIAKNNNLIVIEDTTHSLFSASATIGDYQICSIRKWLPIPSGGVLYSREDPFKLFYNIEYIPSIDNTRSYGMILKDLFLSTGFDCNEEYRKIFRGCEEELDRQTDVFLLSDFSRFIASCIDVDELKKVRIDNYKKLNDLLSKLGITPFVQLLDDNCPFVYPIKISNRDGLRSFLIDNRIYCAVHWPFDGIMKDKRAFAEECANTLISFPIDQRYGKLEMEYLADAIHKYEVSSKC